MLTFIVIVLSCLSLLLGFLCYWLNEQIILMREYRQEKNQMPTVKVDKDDLDTLFAGIGLDKTSATDAANRVTNGESLPVVDLKPAIADLAVIKQTLDAIDAPAPPVTPSA